MNKHLRVTSKLIERGLRIQVDATPLDITYPEKVWKAYPKELKEVLRDNLALSSTYFVPQMLKLDGASYDSAKPLGESFFFKNGLYDMSTSAHTDGATAISYLKRFVNTTASFKSNEVRIPKNIHMGNPDGSRRMMVPFTFGKESLLTVAVAREIGIQPHLMYVVEPAHMHEAKHKEALMDSFFKKTGLSVNVVTYGPGRIRYGGLWKKNTELGWGLQTTEYVMLSLPFLNYWNIGYVALGNEQSCKEASIDNEGFLTYWTAYDQHPAWTPQQGLLASLMLGKGVRVLSLVEPLQELGEVAVLHRRYPGLAQFQTSCLAIDGKANANRWCQNCEKCACMYTFLIAAGVDPKGIGFTEDLFDRAHMPLYKKLFSESNSSYYAVEEEMHLALYLAIKRGYTGAVLDAYKKKVLPKARKMMGEYIDQFFGIHDAPNLPASLRSKIIPIYTKELSAIRKEIQKIL